MDDQAQHGGTRWWRTRRGGVRHVSGLYFLVELRPGGQRPPEPLKLTPNPLTLVTWETYELSKGTPFTALYERLTQLQAEALMWCLQDRASVAQSCTTNRRITQDVNG